MHPRSPRCTPSTAVAFLEGLIADGWLAPAMGGLADGFDPATFDLDALAQGLCVELEHTDDWELATRIAMDHLLEHRRYYEGLAVMEAELERDEQARSKKPKRRKKNAGAVDLKAMADEWYASIYRDPNLNILAHAFADRHNAEFVDCGGVRCVFVVGDGAVLKLPADDYGVKDNLQECANWEALAPRDRRYYAEVIECDPHGEWVLMEQVRPMTYRESMRPDVYEQLLRLRERVNLVDFHVYNVGWRGDELVVLDYGERRPTSGYALNPEAGAESPEDLEARLRATYPLDLLMLYGVADGEGLRVSAVRVDPSRQGEGVGSKVMQEIVDWADATGTILVLTPSRLGPGPSKAKLTRWYKTFGFVPNMGRRKDFRFMDAMIRLPDQRRRNNPYSKTWVYYPEPKAGQSADERLRAPWMVVNKHNDAVIDVYGGLFRSLEDAEEEARIADRRAPHGAPHGVMSYTQMQPIMLRIWLAKSLHDPAMRKSRNRRAKSGKRPWVGRAD